MRRHCALAASASSYANEAAIKPETSAARSCGYALAHAHEVHAAALPYGVERIGDAALMPSRASETNGLTQPQQLPPPRRYGSAGGPSNKRRRSTVASIGRERLTLSSISAHSRLT